MKKMEQILENEKVRFYERMFATALCDYDTIITDVRQLRNCKAKVITYTVHGDDYIGLMSYNTVVAFITPDGTMVDMLRDVYGYSATSAQHIAKFRNDYPHGDFIRYRDI